MERKIKQINIYRTNLAVADPDQGDLSGEVITNSIISDDEGNETERITFDADGNVDERVLVVYKNGKPVEEILEMGGELAERTTREFDDSGKLVRELRHYLDGDPDEISFEYDAEGRMIKRLLTDSDGEEGEKQLWIYTKGLLTREESYNDFGNLEISKTYTYTEDNKPEEIVELNFIDGEEKRLVTLFDENGNIEAEKRYDSQGRLVARSIYTFDENGNNTLIEEENVNGKTTIRLQHDEAGNTILQEELDDENNVVAAIHRDYNTDGQPHLTEVRMENTAQRMGQHYRLRYEYVFFD